MRVLEDAGGTVGGARILSGDVKASQTSLQTGQGSSLPQDLQPTEQTDL